MKYFELEESPYNVGKYMIRITAEAVEENEISTSGSFNVLPARLLNLDYPTYLRFCRDVLKAELQGKNCKYVVPYFKDDLATRQFVKLLNARFELVLVDRKNPLEKYREVGLIK